MRGQGGFAGEADQDAAAAGEDEAAAAEAVHEEAVEEIAEDCDEVEVEQDERRVPHDSQAGEELGVVVVYDESFEQSDEHTDSKPHDKTAHNERRCIRRSCHNCSTNDRDNTSYLSASLPVKVL